MAILLSFTACCHAGSAAEDLATAEAFIDAFYSWDTERLVGTLHPTLPPEERDAIIYYQGWAQGGNYAVRNRHPCSMNTSISCAITVTDDFGETLGYTATDTFVVKVTEGLVSNVTFTGDDPPIFDLLIEWIGQEQPHVLMGPCKDLFAGGTTPGACARAVAEAAREYVREFRN